MIFGKLTSLVVVWGIMMNVFHPLAHAMVSYEFTPDSPLNIQVSSTVSPLQHTTLSPEIPLPKQHHHQDLGEDHCDICHISVHIFIVTAISHDFSALGIKNFFDPLKMPRSHHAFLLDQPPQQA